MNSETVINVCFMREKFGNFLKEVDQLLHTTFLEMDFTWNLEHKETNEADMVIAQLHGTSDWVLEDEVVNYIEAHADETFWQYVYGLQITNYPLAKGCACCGIN